MCTDVDRNDKSRVCEPGSVKVIGRRLIESYAGFVPHRGSRGRFPQGRLRFARCFPQPHVGGDLIGAPKKAAAQAIEIWKKTRAAGTAARSA
jgi:anthranilate synthase